MLMVRVMLVALVIAVHAGARSDELQDRRTTSSATADAWRQGDYARLEDLYGRNRATGARSPAGTHVSARVLYALHDALRSTQDPSSTQAHASMQATLDRTQRWLAARPASSLAAFAHTMARIDLAFLSRGTGLASEVSQAGWAGFEAHVRAAARELDTDKPGRARDEAWYFARIRLARFEPGGQELAARLLDEASQKFPYYYDLYFAAVLALDPKWGGSLEAIEWVADLAARRTRPQDGESAYARVYWSVGQSGPGSNLFESTLAKWPRMKRGFEDLVQRYPDPWNLNAFAWYACMARDSTQLQALFRTIGDQIIPSVWTEGRLARCQRLAGEAR